MNLPLRKIIPSRFQSNRYVLREGVNFTFHGFSKRFLIKVLVLVDESYHASKWSLAADAISEVNDHTDIKISHDYIRQCNFLGENDKHIKFKVPLKPNTFPSNGKSLNYYRK